MAIDKFTIRKILVISLSNIGDIVLTFPVMDILRHDFPDAKIAVVMGPKGEPLLRGNPHFETILYYKKQPLPTLLAWLWQLRQRRFDLVVDLRNTAIPVFIAPRYMSSLILRRDHSKHMRFQHLNHLRSVYPFERVSPKPYAIHISDDDKKYIDWIIKEEIGDTERLVVLSPGAADQKKRWTKGGFATVAERLIEEYGAKVIFVDNEKENVELIASQMKKPTVNLSGRANLTQVAYLLTRAHLVVTNDSGLMHLSSYLDAPVVAVFGHTNPKEYGPWGSESFFVKKEASRSQEEDPRFDHMIRITSDDVIAEVLRKTKWAPVPNAKL